MWVLLYWCLYLACFQMGLYFVTTGWIFEIGLCENSFNQSIKKRGEYIGTYTWKMAESSLCYNTKFAGRMFEKRSINVKQCHCKHPPSCLQHIAVESPSSSPFVTYFVLYNILWGTLYIMVLQ